jgi:hypothetical protein
MSHRSRKSPAPKAEKQIGKSVSLLERQMSRFANAKDTQPVALSTYEQIFEEIRTKPHPVQDEIRQLQQSDDGVNELAIENLKKTQCPGITGSGTFAQRGNKYIIAHSGVLILDFDDLGDRLSDVRTKLLNDPHVWAVWISLRGVGLKAAVLIPADAQRHRQSFQVAKTYFEVLTDAKVDPKCKDVSRLCFISYDPAIEVKNSTLLIELSVPTIDKAKTADETSVIVTLSDARLARFKAAIEADGRLEQIEWTNLDDQPVGFCLCPARHCKERHEKATIYLTPRQPYPLPKVHCHHERCEQVIREYNEWFAATYAEMCFASADKFYRRQASTNTWIQITEGAARVHLLRLGNAKTHTQLVLDYVRDYYAVSYAGPLAGHQPGITMFQSKRILVTDSAKLIEPQKGQWPTLRKFLEGLFRTDRKSGEAFLTWLELAVEAIKGGIFRQSQALCLLGPVNCGKSLLQSLITVALGNRQANPYHYLAGKTTFNGELLHAEHQVIDDPREFVDAQKRRAFGAGIKTFVTTEEQWCHPKFFPALLLNPRWRLTISANDDLESLQAMPMVESDTTDKLVILKADKSPMPLPTRTAEQHRALRMTLISELPAFLYHLLNEWQIPGWLLKGPTVGRYGMASYQHPELVALLDDIAPENQIGRLLIQALFAPDKEHNAALQPQGFYRLGHDEAEEILHQYWSGREGRFVVHKLLRGSNSMQNALGKLAKKPSPWIFPHRIKAEGNRRVWDIYPPNYDVPSRAM